MASKNPYSPSRPAAARRRRLAVLAAGSSIDRQRRRVRRHDELVAQAALQSQPGDAEGLVLVGAVAIDEVVGRLRDAPRHAAGGGVVHLPADRQAARLVEQRVRVAPHHQQRHQVLEERRAPRQQHGRAAHARDRASEMEPVHLGHVALGDREEAGQPRLGREQVVVRRVEAAGAPPRPAGGSRSRTAAASGRTGSRSSCASNERRGARREVRARCRAGRPPASPARRRGCRCPRSRRRRAAAAPACACRTS